MNGEKFKTPRFLYRESEKALRKTSIYFIAQKHCYESTIILNISHVKPIDLIYNWVLKIRLFPLNRTIIKEPFTSIGMIDIYKVDTFESNWQQI